MITQNIIKINTINIKGKIVIAKYGGSWRGIKPKVAYENGAIGCIMYSDPKTPVPAISLKPIEVAGK